LIGARKYPNPLLHVTAPKTITAFFPCPCSPLASVSKAASRLQYTSKRERHIRCDKQCCSNCFCMRGTCVMCNSIPFTDAVIRAGVCCSRSHKEPPPPSQPAGASWPFDAAFTQSCGPTVHFEKLRHLDGINDSLHECVDPHGHMQARQLSKSPWLLQ
jgi:hypothetical protein